MSFRCGDCHKARKGKPVRLVLERRQKVYTNEKGEQVGSGWEIAKETSICNNCDKSRKQKVVEKAAQ